MKPIDARGLPHDARIQTDVCIIGGGLAGIAVAREFIGTERDVCLIESGAFGPDEATQSLCELRSIGYPIRQDFMARARYFGGTSNLWAGRCMRLDAIDLRRREWVPNSGWPIEYTELESFYERAEQLLELPQPSRLPENLGQSRENSHADALLFRHGDLQPKVVTWGRRPLRFRKFGRQLSASNNVRILLNANVTEVVTNHAGRIAEFVRAATLTGRELSIAARVFVLACGGLENARLLLASRRRHAHGWPHRPCWGLRYRTARFRSRSVSRTRHSSASAF
jgi:choline dehydrogenase-like flavoprotein